MTRSGHGRAILLLMAVFGALALLTLAPWRHDSSERNRESVAAKTFQQEALARTASAAKPEDAPRRIADLSQPQIGADRQPHAASGGDYPKSAGLFALLDAQTDADIGPPGWFYSGKNLAAEVAVLDPTAAIVGVKCGESVCRVDIRHSSAAARAKFAAAALDTASQHFATVAATYRYPKEDQTRTVMYIAQAVPLHDAVALIEKQPP